MAASLLYGITVSNWIHLSWLPRASLSPVWLLNLSPPQIISLGLNPHPRVLSEYTSSVKEILCCHNKLLFRVILNGNTPCGTRGLT